MEGNGGEEGERVKGGEEVWRMRDKGRRSGRVVAGREGERDFLFVWLPRWKGKEGKEER